MILFGKKFRLNFTGRVNIMKKLNVFMLTALVALTMSVPVVFAQDNGAQTAQTRNVASGQKMKLKGVVVARDADKIVVRDDLGIDTQVALGSASIKSKGGFFGGSKATPAQAIVRGLYVEIEGTGDGSGGLAANKIRFDKDDMRVAQSIDSRVSPAENRIGQSEERLSQAEQNAQRLSGQLDELVAVSNAARGGAKAAQDSADAAIAGVNATNSRISSLDDYSVQSTATVNFKVASAVLSAEAKQSLDEVAQTATGLKGYVIEITGFASADGDAKKNKLLSQKRAQAVIDYLVENHSIPLRRIGTSYGFGELQAVADNATREGREQNRRVEVKLLMSRGLNQPVEVKSAEPVQTETTSNLEQ
jgi:outer membrane protein OmpA-like peptidoglycan-associated protein